MDGDKLVGAPCDTQFLPFFFGAFIVSTMAVLRLRSATLTGMNLPVMASRPLRLGLAAIGSSLPAAMAHAIVRLGWTGVNGGLAGFRPSHLVQPHRVLKPAQLGLAQVSEHETTEHGSPPGQGGRSSAHCLRRL